MSDYRCSRCGEPCGSQGHWDRGWYTCKPDRVKAFALEERASVEEAVNEWMDREETFTDGEGI